MSTDKTPRGKGPHAVPDWNGRSLAPASAGGQTSQRRVALARMLRSDLVTTDLYRRRPVLHDAVRRVLSRAMADDGAVTARYVREWDRFLDRFWTARRHPILAEQYAVAGVLFGLVAFDEPSDYIAISDLIDELGWDRLAHLQHVGSQLIETSARFPVTTDAVVLMLDPTVEDRLVTSGQTPERAAEVARRSTRAGYDLLLRDVERHDPAEPGNPAPNDYLLLAGAAVPEWRAAIGAMAANPWSPHGEQMLALAEQAGSTQAVAIIRDLIELCRERRKEREREEVAQEIRRLVTLSGVTQRKFASQIGTSPSRLSTYVSGSVVPSAAMLMRISRASRALQSTGTDPYARAVPLYPRLTDVGIRI